MEKECFKCGQTKALTEFYRHSEMADGHLNKCKTCTKKDVTANRNEKIEYYREFDRNRYHHDPRVRERIARTTKRWINLNPDKRKAHSILGNEVRSGRVIKPDICEDCKRKVKLIHGHHDDYSEPLRVTWLCPACHRQRHAGSA